MKYAIDLGSGAVTYILSFIKIGPGIQKLIGGAYADTQTARRWTNRIFILSSKDNSLLTVEVFRMETGLELNDIPVITRFNLL
jgi:hypothetical protein